MDQIIEHLDKLSENIKNKLLLLFNFEFKTGDYLKLKKILITKNSDFTDVFTENQGYIQGAITFVNGSRFEADFVEIDVPYNFSSKGLNGAFSMFGKSTTKVGRILIHVRNNNEKFEQQNKFKTKKRKSCIQKKLLKKYNFSHIF